ncbi:hypothetical protein GALMADRAFT_214980 [Galerina marginata CBS 339.88]|uniref:Uncharacterized protein n=1 Tax=Galerina marginata (strain CBS 339.88) TaxID=685588 RepID=A0A067SF91_GALM3|nr:hypothetical protein GALMADRAFT_214980 [Galerina marginata CBS 339.88]
MAASDDRHRPRNLTTLESLLVEETPPHPAVSGSQAFSDTDNSFRRTNPPKCSTDIHQNSQQSVKKCQLSETNSKPEGLLLDNHDLSTGQKTVVRGIQNCQGGLFNMPRRSSRIMAPKLLLGIPMFGQSTHAGKREIPILPEKAKRLLVTLGEHSGGPVNTVTEEDRPALDSKTQRGIKMSRMYCTEEERKAKMEVLKKSGLILGYEKYKVDCICGGSIELNKRRGGGGFQAWNLIKHQKKCKCVKAELRIRGISKREVQRSITMEHAKVLCPRASKN